MEPATARERRTVLGAFFKRVRNAATVAQKWHATVADHPALTYFLDQSENSMRALPGRVVSPAAYIPPCV